MKPTIFIKTLAIASVLGAPATAFAQAPALASTLNAKTAAEVGVLPKERENRIKKYLIDTETDRNPFAARTKEVSTELAEDTQSEAAKLRALLQKMSVSGIAKGGSGYKANLSGIILEEGEKLPRLIAGQTEDLRVTKITPQEVEITWIDEGGADNPDQILLPVDLEPRVGIMLPGTPKTSAGTRGTLVYHQNEEAEGE